MTKSPMSRNYATPCASWLFVISDTRIRVHSLFEFALPFLRSSISSFWIATFVNLRNIVPRPLGCTFLHSQSKHCFYYIVFCVCSGQKYCRGNYLKFSDEQTDGVLHQYVCFFFSSLCDVWFFVWPKEILQNGAERNEKERVGETARMR